MGRPVPARIDSDFASTSSGGSSAGNKLNLAPLGKKQPLDAATNAKLLDLLAETIAEMQKRYGKWNVAWGDIHKVGRGGIYFPVGGADFESGDNEANFTETLFDVQSKRTRRIRAISSPTTARWRRS